MKWVVLHRATIHLNQQPSGYLGTSASPCRSAGSLRDFAFQKSHRVTGNRGTPEGSPHLPGLQPCASNAGRSGSPHLITYFQGIFDLRLSTAYRDSTHPFRIDFVGIGICLHVPSSCAALTHIKAEYVLRYTSALTPVDRLLFSLFSLRAPSVDSGECVISGGDARLYNRTKNTW